jgi:YhcH/YjgK/YiaL family protein
MAVFGTLETVATQTIPSPAFEAAFDYVKRCLSPVTAEHQRLMAMNPGDKARTELAHGVIAMEACSLTKPAGEGRWESHKAYVDVQVVISGTEIMEVADIRDLVLTEDLTPEKDLLFYQAPASCSRLIARAGFVAVFAPSDGHRPSMAVDAPSPVRKVVVKVPVSF